MTRLLLAAALVSLIACSHSPPTFGLATHHLTVQGVKRTWFELLPTHPKAGAPLMILLAGFESYPTGLVPATGVTTDANQDGFVVALPRQLGGAWNAGACCGTAVLRPDDVAFVQSLISQLVKAGTVDPKRVYAVGFSNGGMLAYRLGCQLTSMLAGIAVVEGALVYDCQPHAAIDTLIIHQTGDPLVPYLGSGRTEDSYGDPSPFPSLVQSGAGWLQSEGCATAPKVSGKIGAGDSVATEVWTCANGTHTVITLAKGGGHEWPRSPAQPIDGMQLVTEFFQLKRP